MSNAAYMDYISNEIGYRDDVDNYALDSNDVDIKSKHIIFFFILGLVVAGLSGITETSGLIFTVASRGLLVLLIASLIMPLRWGVPLFFVLVLVGPDLVQAEWEVSLYGRIEVASIWRQRIGPLRPSWIILGCSLIQIIRTMKPVLDSRVKRAMVWFLTVPFLTGFMYGAHTTVNAASEIIGDIRYALMLIAGAVLSHSFLRKHPKSVGVVLAAFVGGLLGRLFCDVVYWIVGYGPQFGGVTRVSVDSAKSTVVLALLFAVYLLVIRKRIFLGTVLGLSSGLLITVFSTRMIWLTAPMCCAILLYMFGAKRVIIVVPVVLVLAFASLQIIRRVRAESIEALSGRTLGFERAISGEEEGNFLQRLDPMRYSEILNSVNVSMRRFSILWGSGYGSYYRDDVVRFPRKLISAHPEYAGSTGQFHFVHNFLFHTLFKYGIIGAFIIWSLWLPAWVCYRRVFNRGNPSMFNGLLACLLAFVPCAIINLYWTGKAVFINGFLIAIFLSICDLYNEGALESAPEREAEPGLEQA